MDDMKNDGVDIDRRNLLKAAAVGTAGATLGFTPVADTEAAERAKGAKGAAPRAAPPYYNILFVLTDQERFFRPGELPVGMSLPGHERLLKKGISFENHRINSCVCTPSRSVLYTGRHIQQTKMFDNTNFPWIQSMSTEIPTVGHMLREAGYYTAYKGKWHLTKEFETVNKLGTPTKIFTEEMEAYGFSDYFGIGDIIAHDHGGWLHDGITASMGVSWLRSKGRPLAAQGKPWFLAVNLVNPHDVMFLNTDLPGEKVQENNILGGIAHMPTSEPLYAKQWKFDLPRTHRESLTATGRPAAHKDYIESHDALVGQIKPGDERRWRMRHNYYLNCLRDADRNLQTVLDELEASGLAHNTIIVYTADHGDLDGSHNLHAKGATAYREQNNVPLIIVHPAHRGGRKTQAVTSHLDIGPTLIAMTNAAPEKKASITKSLPGKDFSRVLAAPESAKTDAVRDGVLFCYNMFAYIDGPFLQQATRVMNQPDGQAKVQAAIKEGTLKADLMKRGALRSVYDGRYTFTRYFSPKEHNTPTSMESLLRLNDLELFDSARDPDETLNLAYDRAKYGDLVLAMNAKLNRLIEKEIGEDVGQMLPGGVDAGWVATKAVRDV